MFTLFTARKNNKSTTMAKYNTLEEAVAQAQHDYIREWKCPIKIEDEDSNEIWIFADVENKWQSTRNSITEKSVELARLIRGFRA